MQAAAATGPDNTAPEAGGPVEYERAQKEYRNNNRRQVRKVLTEEERGAQCIMGEPSSLGLKVHQRQP